MGEYARLFVGLVLVAVIFAGIYYLNAVRRDKRIAQLRAFATAHGWRYDAEDPALVRMSSRDPFGTGHSRTARDVFRGTVDGHEFVAFEYFYQETRGVGDNQETQSYWYMVTRIATPPSQYFLEIEREGLVSGFLGALGMRDLQLESEDFNKRFRIKAEPTRFAYDVLNPQTMQRMLDDARYEQSLRFENGSLFTWDSGKLDENRIQATVQYLIDTLTPVPGYAWERH